MAADGIETFDFEQLEDGEALVAASTPRRGSVDSRLLTKHLQRTSPWKRVVRWGIGLLVVVALLQEGAAHYYDRQLTQAVQATSGQPDVEVNCRRVWDMILDFNAKPGFVHWGSNTADLQFSVCMNAAAWPNDPNDQQNRVGFMILAHEMAHLAGHGNESTTECVAMWVAPRLALALGGNEEDGRATAQWYAANYNPLLPPEYRAPGCLSGSAPSSRLLR